MPAAKKSRLRPDSTEREKKYARDVKQYKTDIDKVSQGNRSAGAARVRDIAMASVPRLQKTAERIKTDSVRRGLKK